MILSLGFKIPLILFSEISTIFVIAFLVAVGFFEKFNSGEKRSEPQSFSSQITLNKTILNIMKINDVRGDHVYGDQQKL